MDWKIHRVHGIVEQIPIGENLNALSIWPGMAIKVNFGDILDDGVCSLINKITYLYWFRSHSRDRRRRERSYSRSRYVSITFQFSLISFLKIIVLDHLVLELFATIAITGTLQLYQHKTSIIDLFPFYSPRRTPPSSNYKSGYYTRYCIWQISILNL